MEILKKIIQDHEGLRLYPYKCPADKLTIGVGRNIQDNGISFDEAMAMLDNDLQRCHEELSSFYWYSHLCEVRKGALIELCFNIGLTKLLKFKKMISALEKGEYAIAAAEMLDSLWAKQVGHKRSHNMANRLLTGEYEND